DIQPPPRRGRHYAAENLKDRRLARAVRADDAEDLAALDLQVNAPHGLQLAVVFAQAANADRDLRPVTRLLIAPVNSLQFTIKFVFRDFQYRAHRFSIAPSAAPSAASLLS